MVEELPAQTGESRNPDGTFKPGVSGNPLGRPPGSISIVALLKKRLEEVPLGQVKTWAEQIVDMTLENAIVRKDQAAINNIMAHIDGAPKQTVAHEIPQSLVELWKHAIPHTEGS